MTTTLDGILNRRVRIEQPAQGYRVAVDTVLLAAAVPAQAHDKILDLGCGVGGAMLAVACRVPEITGVGIELQPDLVELCRRNITRNLFAAGLDVQQGDIAQYAVPELFDHALMNPPYHEETRHDVSANSIKRTANSEKDGDLARWIDAAARALKPCGTLTLIHRADREEEILNALSDFFNTIDILPILPKIGAAAKRIIIRAQKQQTEPSYRHKPVSSVSDSEHMSPAAFSLASPHASFRADVRSWIPACAGMTIIQARPLILHKTEGGYTAEAEAILRHCQALLFQSP